MAESVNLKYTKENEYYLGTVYHKSEGTVTPPVDDSTIYDGSGVEPSNIEVIYDGGNP